METKNEIRLCHCGHRKLQDCPGEWEQGCNLGSNENFAKVAEIDVQFNDQFPFTNQEYIIKPCPFCGGKATFDHDDNGWNWIFCTQCGASTDSRVSAMDDCKSVLLEQWNKRHEPE